MKPNIGKAVLGGVAGTMAMTFLMYVGGPMMEMPKMDVAAMLGGMLGGWTMGMMMHLVNGIVIFPLIYALILFNRLPGAPALKGLVWGAILWVVAQVIVMPMMGAGLFGLNSGSAMSAVGSLMGHVIYGTLLAWIAGCACDAREGKPVTA